MLDALVLTGGGDVDPVSYGEEPDPEVSGVDTNRDASERALLAAALRVDMPVLAICRGCQVLNIELGGTLYQHVPDVVGNVDHRSAPMVFGDVDVATVPGTVTSHVFGDITTVRCSHHQSIRELGRGLVRDGARRGRHHRGRGTAFGTLRGGGAVASRGGHGPATLRRAGRGGRGVSSRPVSAPERVSSQASGRGPDSPESSWSALFQLADDGGRRDPGPRIGSNPPDQVVRPVADRPVFGHAE